MPITNAQKQAAGAIQDAAAQDLRQTIRLVAGPGTGKSYVIEGRVHWLLSNQNVLPESIIAVSFTRAAAKDLKDRINSYCLARGQANVTDVQVRTLHSLALYLLRRTGNLAAYPTDPIVMDNWELGNIFDAEFGAATNKNGTRSSEIRRDHEAFWSTGVWGPPNLAIQNPITQPERNSFNAFYGPRTQAYSCVLPGELVRMCVNLIQGGHINPVAELGVQHLIVDEVQDLNPCDFEFINILIQQGVNVFICGDDDQSVYSFRYAFPAGIQNFVATYPHSGNHVLNDCFRCTPNVLAAAQGVINNNVVANRIPKNLSSLYTNAAPANHGFVQGNIFNTTPREAEYIANSCRDLIASGVSANDIMILTGNRGLQLPSILTALDAAGVSYDANTRDEFKDSPNGRFLMALLRVRENDQDYIAHRVLLGAPRGVGLNTCKVITDKVINNHLNFRNIFYNPLPNGVFSGRETSAINKCAVNIASIQAWNMTDTLGARLADINTLVLNNFLPAIQTVTNNFLASLPGAMTLEELKDLLETDSEDVKDKIINDVLTRQNQQGQPVGANPMVKVMTFHSSKGLSGKVVFIPGLEEDVFPNTYAKQLPASILECARLLYVAITRAKSACIMSYSKRRTMYGTSTQMAASRFCAQTGIVFSQQNNLTLPHGDLQTIVTSIANL